MRVLFVSANQECSPDPVAPLGVCYVATATADAGHDVAVLDLCFRPDVETAVAEMVRDVRPEAIGISLRNVDNCAYPQTVSYMPHYRRVVGARRAGSGAPIVLRGGGLPTQPPHHPPPPRGSFGGRAAGGGAGPPHPPPPPPRAVAHRGGGVHVNPPTWLPAIDGLKADRRWIDTRRYLERGGMANLQTKRGCHFKCTFCAYPVIEGRGMRTRDPALVAAEVVSLL